MGEGLFHAPLLRALLEEFAHASRINLFNRNDEVGRKDLCRINKQDRALMPFLHPKTKYFFKSVQGIADADALVGHLELSEFWLDAGYEAERDGGNDNENGKKNIAE